jgi:hypothetical protein
MTEISNTAPKFDYDNFTLPENVSLIFHLAPHVNAQDLPDQSELRTIFQETDIVVPEYVHDPESLDALGKIALGNTKAYQNMRRMLDGGDFETNLGAFFSALYNTRVATANIDIDDRHPAVRLLEKSQDKLMSFINLPNFNQRQDDVITAQSSLWDAYKLRDQAILQNISPILNATIKANRKLDTKRQSEPLQVDLFYGSTHKSLLSAVQAKNVASPVEGFSATIASDSYVDEFTELYLSYLRGETIPYVAVERYLASIAILSTLKHKGQINDRTVSGREQSTIFLELSDGLDLGDLHSAVDEASEKYAQTQLFAQ